MNSGTLALRSVLPPTTLHGFITKVRYEPDSQLEKKILEAMVERTLGWSKGDLSSRPYLTSESLCDVEQVVSSLWEAI